MANKKKKKTISINIEVKTLAIIIGIIVVCISCFVLSSKNSEKYHETNNQETEEDVLASITKEAGEIKDSERKEMNKISYDEYIDLYQEDKNSLVLFSRPTCNYCKLATPILENIVYQYDVEINYLNTDELTQEEQTDLQSSDDYFKEGYGTPLLLVVGNNKIVNYIDSLVPRDSYIEFFKENGFMK